MLKACIFSLLVSLGCGATQTGSPGPEPHEEIAEDVGGAIMMVLLIPIGIYAVIKVLGND